MCVHVHVGNKHHFGRGEIFTTSSGSLNRSRSRVHVNMHVIMSNVFVHFVLKATNHTHWKKEHKSVRQSLCVRACVYKYNKTPEIIIQAKQNRLARQREHLNFFQRQSDSQLMQRRQHRVQYGTAQVRHCKKPVLVSTLIGSTSAHINTQHNAHCSILKKQKKGEKKMIGPCHHHF